MGESVVIPNHVHGILILTHDDSTQNPDCPQDSQPTRNPVETLYATRLQSRRARREELTFAWQTRFYDHMIRDAESYNRISHYILNNPQQWHDDELRKADE